MVPSWWSRTSVPVPVFILASVHCRHHRIAESEAGLAAGGNIENSTDSAHQSSPESSSTAIATVTDDFVYRYTVPVPVPGMCLYSKGKPVISTFDAIPVPTAASESFSHTVSKHIDPPGPKTGKSTQVSYIGPESLRNKYCAG